MRYRLQEGYVVLREPVRLGRIDLHDTPARPLHIQRHYNSRAYPQRPFDPRQLVRVLLDMTGVVGLPALKDLGTLATIGQRQAVQAECLLLAAHRRITGAEGNQRVDARIVEEDINLVGAKGSGHQVAGLIERGFDLRRLYRQQAL